jgi:hypothetical protein
MKDLIGELFAVAMEAEGDDDVTEEVSKQQNTMGVNPDSPNEDAELDVPNPETEEGAPTDNAEDTPTDDEGGSEDAGDDQPTDTTDNIDEPETEEEKDEISKKIALRDNMIMLYNILSTNIDLLRSYSPNENDAESMRILFNISANLSDSKEVLFQEITTGFQEKSYVNLLKTYVAINRIYELATVSLEKYFENLKLKYPTKSRKSRKTD